MKVIAAIDNSAAAKPVLEVAEAVAAIFDAGVEALHVPEDGADIVLAEAASAGIPLRMEDDPSVESIVEASRDDEVVAVVLGARGTPGGRRPAGNTALAVITSLGKPVVVVPPVSHLLLPLGKVLIPLDATSSTAAAVGAALSAVTRSGLDVVVSHVLDESSIPMFDEQPQHETEVWVREFLARYCPGVADRARMEVRVGTPERELLAVISDAGCDLVAVGWSQDLSPGRASVVRELLRWSDVPVMLLPVPADVRNGSVEGPPLAAPSAS